MNPRFADIISDYYIMSKFHLNEKKIIIKLAYLQCGIVYKESNGANIPITNSCNQTLWVLKRFGRIFSSLRTEVSDFGARRWQIIFEYASKYCRQIQTKEVVISRVDDEALRNWSYTFDYTTSQVEIHHYPQNSISLNALFPFMDHLIIHEFPLSSVIGQFPHLTKCSFVSYHADQDSSTVWAFIRLNRHLRFLHTTARYNVEYFNYLSEMLLYLKALSIDMTSDSSDITDEIVHFKHVKEFSLSVQAGYYNWNSDLQTIVDNIRFDQLEKLQIKTDFNILVNDRFIEIIARNRGLKTFETNIRMTNESLIGLIEALPELKELTINWYDGIHHSLKTVFEGNYGLNKMTILSWGSDGPTDFLDIILSRWIIVDLPLKGFKFVRIN